MKTKLQFLLLFLLPVSSLFAQTFNVTSTCNNPCKIGSCSNNTYNYTLTPGGSFLPGQDNFILTISFSFNEPSSFLACSCSPDNLGPVLMDNLVVTIGGNTTSPTITNNTNSASFVIANYDINSLPSINVSFDLKLDCSVALHSNTNLILDETWSVDQGISITNNSFSKEVIHPLVSAITTSQDLSNLTTSYLNDLVIEFEYLLYMPDVDATIALEFTNTDLVSCLQSETITTEYLINGNTYTGDLQSFLLTANQPCTLMVRQTISNITTCPSNCSNKSAFLKWKCAYNEPSFCSQCEINDVNENCSLNYSISSTKSTLKIERISPALDALYNNSCNGDITSWHYKITNTGTSAIKTVKLLLSHTYFTDQLYDAALISQLDLIPKNSISYTVTPACSLNCGCTATDIHNNETYIYNPGTDHPTKDETFNTDPLCTNVLNPITSYRFFVQDLCIGDVVDLYFDTYRCCGQDDELYTIDNIENSFTLYAEGKSECAPDQSDITRFYDIVYDWTNPNPDVSFANDVDLFNNVPYTNFIARYGHQRPDLANYNEIVTEFTPDVSDMTGPAGGVIGTPESIFIDLKKFIPTDLLGLNANNLPGNPNFAMKGVLRVKVHCEKGLVCTNLNSDFAFTQSNNNIWSNIGCYTANPDPACEAADYYAYFDMSDPNALSILNNGKFRFNLAPCCAGPVGSIPYEIYFDILTNSDLVDGNGDCQDVNYVSAGNNCFSSELCSTCCWLPITKVKGEINLHCPGCMAPGIIIDSYSLNRKSFGFEDNNPHNGIADNLNPAAAGYFPYDQGFIKKKYSNFGDVIEDKMTAHFTDGTPAPGYTYSDMLNGGAILNYLQMARTVPYANTDMMNAIPQSLTFYIDIDPDANPLPCLDCAEFGIDPSAVQTIAKVDITGNLAPYLIWDVVGADRTYFFTFDVPTINSNNDVIPSPFTSFAVGQRYRLKVTYDVCGNFTTSLIEGDLNNLRKKSIISNLMWLTGSAKSINNWTQSGQNPNTTQAMIDNGDVFDQSFANKYLFWCEAFNGLHYFLPVNTAFDVLENGLNTNQCKRKITTSIFNMIGANYFKNLYPFEYKPAPFFIHDYSFTVPQNWKLTGAESFSLYNGIGMNATYSNPLSLPGNFPYASGIGYTVSNSGFPSMNCLDYNVDLNFPDLNQYTKDEENDQYINLFLEPNSVCNPGLRYDLAQENQVVTIENSNTNCHINTTPCSTSFLIKPVYLNVPSENIVTDLHQPNPHLITNLPNAPDILSAQQVIESICFDFTISNIQVNGQYTDAKNLFIAIPVTSGITWSVNTSCSNTNIPTFISNNYFVIPIGDISIDASCALTLCASVTECPKHFLSPWSLGWSCETITSSLNPETACYFEQLPCSIEVETQEIGLDIVSEFTPPNSVCNVFPFDFKLQLLESGPITINTITFGQVPPGLSIQSCSLIDCNNETLIPTPSVTLQGNNVFLFSSPITLSLGQAVCIRAILEPICDYSAPYLTPTVQVSGTTFCNSDYSSSVLAAQNLGSPDHSCCATSCTGLVTVTAETSENCTTTFTIQLPIGFTCPNLTYQWYIGGYLQPYNTPVINLQPIPGDPVIWGVVNCNGVEACKDDIIFTQSECDQKGCTLLEDGLSSSEKANSGRDILKTSDGGYMIVGEISESFSDKDFYAIKYDQNGVVQFKLRYGDGESVIYNEIAFSAVETNDAFYVTGSATSSVNNNIDVAVTKILKSPPGTIDWSKRYDFGDDDFGRKIIDVGNGKLLIAGYTNSRTNIPLNDYDILAFTINSSGVLQEKNIYGNAQGTKSEFAYDAIKLSGSNHVILAGEYRTSGKDILLVKISLNASLQMVASKILSGNRIDVCNSIVEGSNGIWATGFSNSWSTLANDTDVFVSKFGFDLSPQSFYLFGTTQFDESANRIKTASNGKLLLAGWRRNSAQKYDGQEIVLEEANPTQNIISEITGYPNNNNLFYSADEFPGGKTLLVGNYTVSSENTEVFRVLTNSSGDACCLSGISISSNAGSTPNESSLPSDQDVGTPVENSSFSSMDWISSTILCEEPPGRFANASTEPGLFNESLLKVYPNPTKTSFTVELEGTTSFIKDVEFYDIAGRKINPGIKVQVSKSKFDINCDLFADGLYFIVATDVNNQTYKSKIIIQK